MKHDFHLVPQIIIDVAATLGSGMSSENERLNAILRLEAVKKFIDATLLKYEQDKVMKGKKR